MYHASAEGLVMLFRPGESAFRFAGLLWVVIWLLPMPSVEAGTESYGFTPFLRAGYLYDSNVFRLTGPAEAEVVLGDAALSDEILRMGGGLDFRMPISQQTLALEIEAFYNKYDRFDFLNHTSGLASANWHWIYGDRWDGNLKVAFTRELQGFEESRITEKDLRDQWDFLASGNYAISPRWQLHLAAARSDYEHGLSSRQTLDRTVDRGVFEVRYLTPRKSYLGYKVVVRSAELPNQALVETALIDNSYLEYENSLTVDWAISAHSGFNGRLGYTKREYDSFSQRDFSGLTWQLVYQWHPQTRYELKLSLWRDLDAYSDMVSSYVDETGGRLEGVWVMTSKVSLKADYSRKFRSFDGDPRISPTTLPSRQDRLVGYGLSVEYALRERLSVNLGYLFEERKSNVDEWVYDYYNLMLGITATF
jgi:exopolysaccharide biosynthesis operon protein EpsL